VSVLKPGRKAPLFTLPADDGSTVSLKELRGSAVVLFFYPKDDTETCTVEACGFRDSMPRFDALDAVVLGVSADGVRSHARFRAKYALPYRLLADTEHVVAEKYGVWQEKQLFGRRYMGIVRTTFVIDVAGRIARVFEKVRAAGHADEVAATIAEL